MNAKALKTTLFLSTLFVIVYGSTNMLATHRHSVGSFYFAWERGIPFIARAIVPYMSIDFFFLGAPFLARDEQELKTIARRISVAIILSGLCFLFFPLRFAFNRPPATGILGIIFDRFRNFDQPFNQFPSLHITLAVLLLQIYARRTTGALRALIAAWFTLIVISTLLTFQHHCIDLAGGFALAAVCIYLFPDDPVHSQTMGNRSRGFLLWLGISNTDWSRHRCSADRVAFTVARVFAGYCCSRISQIGRRRLSEEKWSNDPCVGNNSLAGHCRPASFVAALSSTKQSMECAD